MVDTVDTLSCTIRIQLVNNPDPNPMPIKKSDPDPNVGPNRKPITLAQSMVGGSPYQVRLVQ